MNASGATCTSSRSEDTSSQSHFTSSQEWRKRAYDNAVGNEVPDTKRRKFSYHYVLESESDLPTDEDTESEHSAQGKETDVAKDTSDTSSSSDWSESAGTVRLEYEIETSSEKPSLNSESFSSGTDEDFVRTTDVIAAIIDDDLGLFADTSNSDSEPVFDPELPRTDYWNCVQCKNRKQNPLFRYCKRCFQLRKDFLPPRPRPRKSQKKKKKNSKPPSPPPLPSSFDSSAEMDNSKKRCFSELTTDSGYQCSEPASPQPSTSREISEVNDGPELCITCMSRPKNGIFVHAKIGHICCCYKCALRVWKGQGRCPLCHCQIKNVLQAFSG